ncbi:MAG: hypothetical protein GIKADHBN_03380 [Phycisphaerales bacterium]|nr:hypothetical protein [Phycisphaerales bacterium]
MSCGRKAGPPNEHTVIQTPRISEENRPARRGAALALGESAGRALMLAALVALCSCQTEPVLVYNRPFLGGLPGAESQTPISRYPKGYVDPTFIPDDQLVVKDPEGKPTELRAKTARHLMMHIYNTLMNSQGELFVEQVLSEQTRGEFYARGVPPIEAFKLLQDRAGDVLALFERMPMGESTPGLFLEPVQKGVQRLRVQGMAARDLYWVGFDMVMEKGNWRLVWFVPGKP